MIEPNVEPDQTTSSDNVRFQVPAIAIGAVRPMAEELYKAGIPLSRAVLATKLSTTITSSGFNQKIAAAKYYGFITLSFGSTKVDLTELGERFAQGDLAAAQEGFMTSAFGHIASGLAGRNTDPSTVALHLTEKAHVPSASATRLADVLLRSAKEAQLLTGSGFNAERLEELVRTSKAPAVPSGPQEILETPIEALTTPPPVPGHPYPPAAPQASLSPSSSLPGIPLGDGFSLVHPVNLPLDIIADARFTNGLKQIREAIAAAATTSTASNAPKGSGV